MNTYEQNGVDTSVRRVLFYKKRTFLHMYTYALI